MITVRLNGRKLKVAQCYEELTVDQLQQLVRYNYNDTVEDWLKIFSILSGMDFSGVRDSKDLEMINTLYSCVRWVYKQPYNFELLEMPRFFIHNGKTLEIPKKLGRMSIGQAILVRQRLDKAKDLRECLSIAVAVYMQPLIDETPFDVRRAEKFEQEILQMKATRIFPIGFFLLEELVTSGKPLKRILLLLRRMSTSVERKLLNWHTSTS